MKGETKKPRSPEQYDEEYRALQASLEDYLRQHVKLLAEAGRADAGSVPEGWFRRYRADVYFVVTLLLIGFLGWRVLWPVAASQDDPSAVEADSGAAASAQAQPSSAATATSEASLPAASPASKPPPEFDDPTAWWNGYVEGNRARLAAWLSAVAEARGLAPDEVSERQKSNFERWAEKFRSGAETADERNNCRIGLFEYFYGRWARDDADAAKAWDKVDLVVGAGEYPAEKLRALLSHLQVDHWFEQADAEDRRIQTAVVLGWLENHQL